MPGAQTRFAALLLIVAALPLAGCETTGDPLGSMMASPGQYDYFDCPAIKRVAADIVKRRRVLEGLMARAKQGPGGSFVSATTYEPEYVTLRGKMSELRRAAAEKHCNFDPAAVPMAQSPQARPGAPLPPPPKKKSFRNIERR